MNATATDLWPAAAIWPTQDDLPPAGSAALPETPLRVLHVIPALGQGGAERLLADLVRHAPDGLVHRIISLTDQPAFFDGSYRDPG
jgi:hypothetical protein